VKYCKAFLIYIAVGAIIGIVAGTSVIIRGYADPVNAGISDISKSIIILLFIYHIWPKKRQEGGQEE